MLMIGEAMPLQPDRISQSHTHEDFSWRAMLQDSENLSRSTEANNARVFHQHTSK